MVTASSEGGALARKERANHPFRYEPVGIAASHSTHVGVRPEARATSCQATSMTCLPTTPFCGSSGMRKARDRVHLCPPRARNDFAISNDTGTLGDVPGGSG